MNVSHAVQPLFICLYVLRGDLASANGRNGKEGRKAVCGNGLPAAIPGRLPPANNVHFSYQSIKPWTLSLSLSVCVLAHTQ